MPGGVLASSSITRSGCWALRLSWPQMLYRTQDAQPRRYPTVVPARSLFEPQLWRFISLTWRDYVLVKANCMNCHCCCWRRHSPFVLLVTDGTSQLSYQIRRLNVPDTSSTSPSGLLVWLVPRSWSLCHYCWNRVQRWPVHAVECCGTQCNISC